MDKEVLRGGWNNAEGLFPLLKKQRKPDPTDNSVFESYTRANEDLNALLFLLIEQSATMNVQKHVDDAGISGVDRLPSRSIVTSTTEPPTK